MRAQKRRNDVHTLVLVIVQMGYVAAEYLLEGKTFAPLEMGMLLANAASSLHTDICKEYSFLEVYESIMFTFLRGDVYKRQAGNCARGMSLVALHNGGGVGIGKAVNGGFGTVSYTHLDVYKRQVDKLARREAVLSLHKEKLYDSTAYYGCKPVCEYYIFTLRRILI